MNQYDEELEKAVLGAILLDPAVLAQISPILQPEFFHHRANQIIYRCLLEMQKKRDHIDLLTVPQALKAIGRLEDVGGDYYVSNLTSRVAGAGNIEHHVRILHQFYLLRELAKLGAVITSKAGMVGADCFDLVDEINKRLAELTDVVSTKIPTVGDIFNKLITRLNTVAESGIKPGIPSGLENLDRHTGGWQKGNLIVIAARPGMGKSAFALQCAKYPALALKKSTAIFSLEMGDEELVGRMASSESQISSEKFAKGDVTRKDLQDLSARCFDLIGAEIYIDDTPALKFADLRAKARRLKDNHNIELLIVDYLQLAHGDERGNREQEISYISRNLKALAKELDIPVIALSQLSRQVESASRADRRPILSDLRESGAIEQDADIVCFLYRPAYYKDLEVNKTGYEYKGQMLPTNNLLVFDIAKARALKTGELMLKFYGQYMMIRNYDDLPYDSRDTAQPMQPNTDFLNPTPPY